MLPMANLRLMAALTDPTKPLGFDVVIAGRAVATISYAKLKAAVAEHDALQTQQRQSE